MDNPAVPRHQRPNTVFREFLFGVPYYPEHWTPQDREHDAEWMAAAGVNVVRMAEFAWDLMEKQRGRFDFSFFDEAIEHLARHGIRTILCTPTATPPRWLTVERPDILRVDAEGRRMEHGTRQHACTTHPDFRLESRRITQAMAEHFAANPHVIGWQIDNELNCHFSECYCPACRDGFIAWLQKKYKNVAALNQAWGTAFWAQTYNEFSQIPLPYRNGRPATPNPGHELDYCRFLSDQVIEFQRQQMEILHQAATRWWITHNGYFGHIDYWKFAQDLDMLGVDVYPGFCIQAPEDSYHPAMSNELCRAQSGTYIIPEQQSGPGGQKTYLHATARPGQMRLWAYQSIAHGADALLHFRWRTCRFGAEEYWCGVLDHDNIPRRRYEEFSREGNELKAIGGHILGSVEKVRAAVLLECDQNDAHATMPNDFPSPANQTQHAFRQMWRRHWPCGFVHMADLFDGLQLLVLPSMPLMDEALAAKLRAFVEGGGVLVATPRSASRNRDNQVIAQTPPGLLAPLMGATVEEYGHLRSGELTLTPDGKTIPSGQVYEILRPRGAEVVGTWNAPSDGSPHAAAGEPAITAHRVGKGVAMYLGTYLTEENADAIMELLARFAPVASLAQCDEAVEVTCRHSGKRELYFVLNHYGQAKTVSALPQGIDLLSRKPCAGTIELEPYGVAIIER